MANKKISDYTAVTSLASGDMFEIETAGGNSRKITKANLGLGFGDFTDLTFASAATVFGVSYKAATTTFVAAAGDSIEVEVEVKHTTAQSFEVVVGQGTSEAIRLSYQSDGNKLFYHYNGTTWTAVGATGSSNSVAGLATIRLRLSVASTSAVNVHGMLNDQRLPTTDETSFARNLVGTLTVYVDNTSTILRARARKV